ncbi:hypothetical protein A2U01_0056737, partial [Trifolium medium]|nr:hypothetical protein [Trifolium medium]
CTQNIHKNNLNQVLSLGLAQRTAGDQIQTISGSLASNGERWRLPRSATKTLAQRAFMFLAQRAYPSLSDASPEFRLSLDNLP